MPIHDWIRVEAGIFHAFHHDWITELARALNRGLLPDDYYALPEQQAAGFGPDVLTLQTQFADGDDASESPSDGTATIVRARPQSQFTAETDAEFYRRKKSSIVVRHVSGDRIVAMLEVISPGNKASRHALRAFVEKACELLEHRIHLLIVDPLHASVFGARRARPGAVGSHLSDRLCGHAPAVAGRARTAFAAMNPGRHPVPRLCSRPGTRAAGMASAPSWTRPSNSCGPAFTC
jgi:hypothetical protein